MATRMQQRRGTYQQWFDYNPILSAAEIGWESDTNKFKVGDGINHWNDLAYFADQDSLTTSLGDYISLDLLGAANGVAQLNSSGKLVSDQIPNIDEITQDAIDSALVAGNGITKSYDDPANTITISVDTTVVATKAELTESAQDAVNTALVAGTGLDKTYDDASNTITLDIDSTVATKTYADDAVSTHSSDTTSVHGISDTAELATKAFAASLLTGATKTNIVITGDKDGLTITAENGVGDSTTSDLAEGTNLYFTDERAQDAVGNVVGTGLSYDDASGAISVNTSTIQARVADVSDTEIGYLNGVTSGIQTQIDSKAALAGATFTGDVTVETNLIIDGNLTVSGTTTTVNTTDLSVTDPMIYMGDGNTGNLVDLGIVSAFNDGTYQHTGLVRDSSANTWKLFKGVTDEPTTVVNFAQGSLDDLAVGGLTASSLSLSTALSIANGGTGATTAATAAANLLPSQTSNSGKYLTTDGAGTLSWGTVSGYSAPTLGSTSIASGATVTTIVGLTKLRSAAFTSLDANSYEQDLQLMQLMGAL